MKLNRYSGCSYVAALLLMLAYLGLTPSGMTLFYVPVTQDLGFTQASFALYFSLQTLSTMVVMPFAGKLISKYFKYARWIVLVSVLANFAGVFLYSRCNMLWQFYACSILRGVVASPAVAAPANMMVNNWFTKSKGLLVSLLYVAQSVGGIFYTNLSRYVIDTYGWRMGYVALSICVLVFGAIIVPLVHPGPQYMTAEKLKRYSIEVPVKTEEKSAANSNAPGVNLGQAAKWVSFWVMLVGIVCVVWGSVGHSQFLSASLRLEYGYSNAEAAQVFSVVLIGGIIGKTLYGIIVDKWGFRPGVIFVSICMILGFVFLFKGDNLIFAYLSAIFGGAGAMAMPTASLAVSAAFGVKDFGGIYGFFNAAVLGGTAVGATLINLVYDLSGTYRTVWAVSIVLMVLHVAIMVIFSKVAQKKWMVAAK